MTLLEVVQALRDRCHDAVPDDREDGVEAYDKVLALITAARAEGEPPQWDELAALRRGFVNIYHLITGKDCPPLVGIGMATSAVSELLRAGEPRKLTDEQRRKLIQAANTLSDPTLNAAHRANELVEYVESLMTAPAPVKDARPTERRKGHGRLRGRPLDENGAIEFLPIEDAPTLRKLIERAIKMAWKVGSEGGSVESITYEDVIAGVDYD